jgi:hypothetical protein
MLIYPYIITMGSKQTPMDHLYHAQTKSRIDQLPRIRIGSKGERYGIWVRTETTRMKVPVYNLSFLKKTEQGRALSCDLSFYITGKALVIKSMKWALAGAKGAKRKEIPVDGDACEIMLHTLKEIAQRHKVQSIYASQSDVPRSILIVLGFSLMGSHDHMHLEVSKPGQKH